MNIMQCSVVTVPVICTVSWLFHRSVHIIFNQPDKRRVREESDFLTVLLSHVSTSCIEVAKKHDVLSRAEWYKRFRMWTFSEYWMAVANRQIYHTSTFHRSLISTKTSYSSSISLVAFDGVVCWGIKTTSFATVNRNTLRSNRHILKHWSLFHFLPVLGAWKCTTNGSREKASSSPFCASGYWYLFFTLAVLFLHLE